MGKNINQKKLSIPANASDRNDFIQGIGKKEASIIGIAILVAVVMISIAFLTGTNTMLWLFIAIFEVVVVVLAIKRDITNESLVDKIKFIIRYQKSQKKYEYKKADFLRIGEVDINDSK